MEFNFNRMWSGFSKNAETQMDKAADKEKNIATLSPVDDSDAMVVDIRNVFGMSGYGSGMGVYDSNTEMDEVTSINACRELAMRPEVSQAISEITTEAVVADYQKYPLSIVFNDTIKSTLTAGTKKKIVEEFEHVLRILRFDETAVERFRQWYVDGKCYYHAVLDPDNPKNGIVDIRQIDPRHIKKVIETEEVKKNGVTLKRVKDEYYKYTSYIGSKDQNNAWESQVRNEVVKIHPDSVAYANSGIFRETQNGETLAISHLEKAIKPANQLKLLEDALVIYRLARAPERRVFNVDVGSMPKIKAEQYMASLMTKYRNKMTYNSSTGNVSDQRNLMSMLEDYWLPRREGRGTDITTLPGGQGLGQIEDVDYFRKKLYNSLNVPSSRMMPETMYALGRSGEITREEVKFSKFIMSLRAKFSHVLLKLLEIQLVQKNVLSALEFRENAAVINFQWENDMHWKELADADVLQGRLALLQAIEPYIGKFYDAEMVMRDVLKFNEKEIELAKKHQADNQIDPNENDGETEPDNAKDDDDNEGDKDVPDDDKDGAETDRTENQKINE